MLTPQEEQRIRESVRHGLENILGRHEPGAPAPAQTPNDADRLAAAERIIAEETERYYGSRGLVKQDAGDGRVHWLRPEDVGSFRAAAVKSRSRRRRRGVLRSINPKVALVWGVTIALAILVVAYLVQSETLAGIGPDGL